MAPLASLLESRFQLHVPDLPGHGAAPLNGPFTTAAFSSSLIAWLEQQALGPLDVFGYSMGGYVALDAARQRPALFRSIATLGTKFAWSADVVRRELRLLDPAMIRTKVPTFADLLARRHRALGWEDVLRHTAALMTGLGEAPLLTADALASVPHRVRVMVGDRDSTVSVDESAAAAKALPQGQLEVLPLTPHPFEKAPFARIAWSATEFWLDGPA
jgi:pimeloyl-ACP methyl ester carboxylesterase